MPGNASTAAQSSIRRLPIIEEIASPPKSREKLKRPPCNTGAGRHRSSGIAYVGVNSERTEVLGYVRAITASERHTLIHAPHCLSILTVFSLLPSAISHRPEQTFNLTRRRSEPVVVTESQNPLSSTPSPIDSLSHSKWPWCGMPGRNKSLHFSAHDIPT
jgi:hypothetical protein